MGLMDWSMASASLLPALYFRVSASRIARNVSTLSSQMLLNIETDRTRKLSQEF